MIELLSVDIHYGSQIVLDGFCHRFPAGSLTAITGPSGIGKTTLLNVIAGLLPIKAGQVRIGGQVTDRPDFQLHPAKRQLGFVFQSPALWPHFSVRQNILYGVNRLPSGEADRRLTDLCDLLKISDILSKHPGELSGGQARRVSLARTLIVQPTCLLFDEPFNHLDQQLKADVLQLIRKYRQTGDRTLIVVSHEPDDVRPAADFILAFRPSGLN